MHILVTNDDGVNAPGIAALARAMRSLGRVSVVAPDRNWSASGHVKTLHRPLRTTDTTLADGSPAIATDGAPSDCVALALLGLIEEKVDLVVSGINPNANVGHDLTYSGTVTAAMEAVIFGVPGIAVSLDAPEHARGSLDFSSAEEACRRVVEQIIARGLSPSTLLNLNIPYLPINKMGGVAVTRQGVRIYRDELVPRTDPHGRTYYWIGGEAPDGIPEEGTDIGALASGAISLTPLHLDLTAYPVLEEIRRWQLRL